jgi:hypothetical protein
MGKPTKEELSLALAEAQRRLDTNEDHDGLAGVFLQQYRRYEDMLEMMGAVKTYFDRREDERAHTILQSASEELRRRQHKPPADSSLRLALGAAGHLRETGQDHHFLAKSLMNISYLLKSQDIVWDAVRHYLHSGRAATEHERLRQAYANAMREEHRTAGVDDDTAVP